MKYIPSKIALDNAAKIYPASKTKKWNAVFGVSAVMKQRVNPIALSQAVKDLSLTFETMYMYLEKGFLWDTLTPANHLIVVEPETERLCRPFNLYAKGKPLFRVVYNDKKIRVEMSHCLTDGTGAYRFLTSLVLRYCEITENKTIDADGVAKSVDRQSDSQKRDEFYEIYSKGIKSSRKDCDAYQLNLASKNDYLRENPIIMPVSKLKRVSKAKYKCTVTQYLAAVYAMALIEKYKADANAGGKKPVKLSIPVNLRNMWQSDTLRNFSSYVTINVMPKGEYTFAQVLDKIITEMNIKIQKEKIYAGVCQNVADEQMPIAQYSPGFLKKAVMKQCFRLYGERKYTSTLTSIGYIDLPCELKSRIEYIYATLGATYLNKINCTVTGVKDMIIMNISSVSEDVQIDKAVIKILDSHGISCMDSTEKPLTDMGVA